eukprot:m.78632 g.78632  ORF g.78632 m.78632 type:complete len:444 (+) comp9233_c0_seq1:251-1582(+)
MDHMRYSAGFASPSRGSPPRKAPYTDVDATGISINHLNRTPQGRQSTFETRMAMQRELDTSRSQLAASREAADGMRRQALTSREDAAQYRAENLRLSDELRSCKHRLNAALDGQEDILRKNTEKHAQIHDLQNREAELRDELANKTGLLQFYQDQNEQLEKELAEAVESATAAEGRISDELKETLVTLDKCRRELQAARDTAASEREEVKQELEASIRRLEAVQAAQNELRAEITVKDNLLAAKDAEIATLSLRLNEKDEQLAALGVRSAALQVEAEDAALLRASTNHLADQLAGRRFLAGEGGSPPLPTDPRDLAAAVEIETEKSRAAIDASKRVQVDAEVRSRAIDAEMAAARARAGLASARHTRMTSRGYLGRPYARQYSRPLLHSALDGARDADREAARALRSYYSVRSGRPTSGGSYRYEVTTRRRHCGCDCGCSCKP